MSDYALCSLEGTTKDRESTLLRSKGQSGDFAGFPSILPSTLSKSVIEGSPVGLQ